MTIAMSMDNEITTEVWIKTVEILGKIVATISKEQERYPAKFEVGDFGHFKLSSFSVKTVIEPCVRIDYSFVFNSPIPQCQNLTLSYSMRIEELTMTDIGFHSFIASQITGSIRAKISKIVIDVNSPNFGKPINSTEDE